MASGAEGPGFEPRLASLSFSRFMCEIKLAKQFDDMCVVGVGTVIQALSYCEEACAQQSDLYRLG